MRDAFLAALRAMRERDDRIIVLDADCARSTRTDVFEREWSASFVNVGIAEQHMVGMAVGLSMAGLYPIACSFASMLTGRAADQILGGAHQGVSLMLAGHYAGVSAAREGALHHSIADLAIMRAVPGACIYAPAVDGDVLPLMEQARRHDGIAYVRLSREAVASTIGEPNHAAGVRTFGRPGEVLLLTVGPMFEAAAAAVRALERYGISAMACGLLRLKPFPDEIVKICAGSASVAVTLEEHNVVGGIAGAVAQALLPTGVGRLIAHGIPDRFTQTGSYQELLEHYGLCADHVVARIRHELGAVLRGEA